MSAVVQIGGRDYGGWTDVQVTRSLDDLASPFALSATLRYPGDDNPVKIPPGARCRVLLDGLRVLTGYVEVFDIDTSADSRVVSLAGRSKTLDLVASSVDWSGGAWKNRTVDQIAADVCRPFGIDVVVQASSDPIPLVRVQQGETVFDLLDRIARLCALLLTDDADGNLVITRVGTTKARGRLSLPGNVLRSKLTIDVSQRYSEYICRGQTVGDDRSSGTTVAAVSGSAKDTIVERYRPLILAPPTPVDRAGARTFAAYEASTRAGRSVNYEASVVGWLQTGASDAPLWTPGEIVPVKDASCGVNAQLVMASATFEQSSDSGTTTSMELAPGAGFEALTPLSKPKGRKSPQEGIGIWDQKYGRVEL